MNNPIEMMQQMVNPGMEMPQIVNPGMEIPQIVNPGMENPQMVNPGMEIPQMVNPGMVMPQMEQTMVTPGQVGTINPVQVENNQTMVMPQMDPIITNTVVSEIPVSQKDEEVTAVNMEQMAINAVENQTIGTQMNLQNGLDLENVLTPEESVKLTQKEVVVEPIKIGGLESIGSCKTSTWSALITILDFIAKDLSNNDIIAIDNGSIDTHRNGNFIHCDMKNILGNISLNLTSPDTSVKLLKLIKGGELIQIFKESSTNSYMFCNIQDGNILTRVKTSYAADTVTELSKAPLLPNPVFKKEIPNQEKEIIKTIISGRSAVGSEEPYRFGFSKADNSLVSIGVGKDFTHFFKDSSIETDEYRVYNPFPVPNMESCIMEFFKCQDGTTWIRTISNISVSSIICTEKVELIDSSIEDFNFN